MIEYGTIQLRALEKTDLPALQEWRNRKHFRDHFREYRELSMDHQEAWYSTIKEKNSPHQMFGVVLKGTEELIGAAGLCYIHLVYRNADLSFYIGKDDLYADKQYGKDTVLALMQYGFNHLGLKRIWCEIYETDRMKTALLSQLGFQKEGVLRANTFKNGTFINGQIFAILEDEFKALNLPKTGKAA